MSTAPIEYADKKERVNELERSNINKDVLTDAEKRPDNPRTLSIAT